MSERHVQRLSVVIAAVVAALVVLFWPVMHKLVYPHEPMGSVLNLRPGIDMVGGTSLVYSIKQPPGGWHPPGGEPLSVAEMTALKRRVDPLGEKNLIWRPQGNDRLEIQLPMTPEVRAITGQRDQLEQQLAQVQAALDATNIRPQDVIDAVEQINGKTRADLPKLELGSPQRKALFAQLCTVWDAIQTAQKHQNADEQAKQSLVWDDLTKSEPGHRSAIEETNLGVGDLESALSGGPTSPALATIKAHFIGWPQRLAAIDQYAQVYDGLSKLKGTIDTSNDLKRELQGAGVLEFHILVDETEVAPADLQKLRDRLETLGPRVEAGDTMRWYEIESGRVNSVHGINATYNGKEYVLAWITADKSLDDRPGTPAWRLTGARPETDQLNTTVIGFTFDPQGGQLFGKLTGDNINRPMAIMLDNKVISVAKIEKQITERGQISGGADGFSRDEIDYMVDTLTAGSLPAELSEQPISEQTVGPQLGQDNLHRGLLACVLGLVVVAVFLTSYYYIGGMVATFAVLLNVTLILAVMAGLSATFTLPSVAGIVLTIGTAVDAHVLIFERLREEQHRGLSLRLALRNAHGKALSAIVDSNMTTVITSIFLIWFGTEEVKGFGITLIIGIVASLFTALFVTRTILEILIEDFGLRNLNSFPLTFPKWDKLLRPSIDWMKLAPYFIAFSVVGVGSGLGLFYHYARAGEVLNIEFTSGTSVQFALKQQMPIQDVRALLDKADLSELPSFSLVSIGEGNLTYEVATPNPNAQQVRDAVIKSLVNSSGQSVLNAEVPSSFDGAGKPLTDVQNKQVIPITDQTLRNTDIFPGPFRPKGIGDFNPGVAIYLNHLDPPLSVTQIKQRISDEQQSESGGVSAGAGASSQDFVVVGANGASSGGGPTGAAQSGLIDQPVSSAVILATQAGLDYTKDITSWQTQLADPLWRLVNYGVNRPAQLQQVKNFDAAVAGDTKDNALLALSLSIIVIMIYIWIRFGNLKYGTATVIALIHDTLFTIAALGFAHYIFNFPALASFLQIDPFRIDLTIVAGILTIMGYSMIDTIVVFDRIRENRGKFGHVNRQVINDAINQTLSRTLLTAGTTTITVAIMYFVGGPGIHGFTFVLLVGILVGTYSSIAIAAPFLLLGGNGGDKDQPARPKSQGLPVKPLQKAGT